MAFTGVLFRFLLSLVIVLLRLTLFLFKQSHSWLCFFWITRSSLLILLFLASLPFPRIGLIPPYPGVESGPAQLPGIVFPFLPPVQRADWLGVLLVQGVKGTTPRSLWSGGFCYKDKPYIIAVFSYTEIMEAFATQDKTAYRNESSENFLMPLDRYPCA